MFSMDTNVFEKKINQAIRDFWGINIYPELGITCYAPTGQFYKTLTHIGWKREGYSSSWYADSPKEASRQYSVHLKRELKLKTSMWKKKDLTLYWRQMPTIEWDEEANGFRVYSRLLISVWKIKEGVLRC